MVIALAVTGHRDQAMAAADALIEAAEASHNPWSISYALLAWGLACRGPHAERGLEALRRGLLGVLGRLEAESGEPLAAVDHLPQAIRNYHDSGNSSNMTGPLAMLASFLDRIGRCEPAATIAEYALNPLNAAAFPELKTAIAHLHEYTRVSATRGMNRSRARGKR